MIGFVIGSSAFAYLVFLLAWWLKGSLNRREVFSTLIITAVLFATGLIFERIWLLSLAAAFYFFGTCLGLLKYLLKPTHFTLKGNIISKVPEEENRPAFIIQDENDQEREFVLRDVYQKKDVGDAVVFTYEKAITDKVYLIDAMDETEQTLIDNPLRLQRIRRKYRTISQLLLSVSLLAAILFLIYFFQRLAG